MKFFRKCFSVLSPVEWGLYLASVAAILTAFFACRCTQYLYLAGSLLGATSLIFLARGNPAGQVLTILFSCFYGYVSFTFRYYGEMITYLGMTAPIAAAALVSWLRHPFGGNRAEVTVNRPPRREYLIIFASGAAVTAAFFFLLRALDTAMLPLSTLSVFTSWVAVCLTVRRSPFYALGYAANDIVLVALWVFAAAQEREYICMVICFAVFLLNDLYGFWSWRRMQKRQAAAERAAEAGPSDAC